MNITLFLIIEKNMDISSVSRRWFLSLAGAFTLTACAQKWLWVHPSPSAKVQEPVSSEVGEILQDQEALFQQMQENTHEDDIRLFADMFHAWVQDANLVQKLREFQTQNGLPWDGKMWPATLEALYTKVFIKSPYLLSELQHKRLEIFTSLQNYEADRGKLPTSVPNPFDNTKFFGGASQKEIYPFLSIPGTYLTQGIYDVPLQDTPNTLYIERNSQGKMILRMYDTTGNLYISAFVSGGTSETQSPENLSTTTNYAHLYHVSSSFPEDTEGGAPMYAATQINTDGIWVHSSASMIDGLDHSHGCFRVGLLYAKALHDYVSAWNTLNVVIWNLYN